MKIGRGVLEERTGEDWPEVGEEEEEKSVEGEEKSAEREVGEKRWEEG